MNTCSYIVCIFKNIFLYTNNHTARTRVILTTARIAHAPVAVLGCMSLKDVVS